MLTRSDWAAQADRGLSLDQGLIKDCRIDPTTTDQGLIMDGADQDWAHSKTSLTMQQPGTTPKEPTQCQITPNSITI